MAARKAVVLRTARQAAGLSVARAASTLGVSSSTLKRWEIGDHLPSNRAIEQHLCKLGHEDGSTFHTALAGSPDRHWEDETGTKSWPLLRLLRSRRRRSGVRLSDIAIVTGHSVATLHRYECGIRMPDLGDLPIIGQAYGLRSSEITGLINSIIEGPDPAIEEPGPSFLHVKSEAHLDVFRYLQSLAWRSGDTCKSVQALMNSLFLMGDHATLREVWPMLRQILPLPHLWPAELKTSFMMLKVVCHGVKADPIISQRLRGEILRTDNPESKLVASVNMARLATISGYWEVARDWLHVAEPLCEKSQSTSSHFLVQINRLAVDFCQFQKGSTLTQIRCTTEEEQPAFMKYIAHVALIQAASSIGDTETVKHELAKCAELEELYGVGSPLVQRFKSVYA